MPFEHYVFDDHSDSNELKDQYEKAKKEVEKKEENNKQYQKEELLRILRQNLANKE